MWTISSIKASAMEKFKANYGSSVLVLVLAGIIIFAAESLGSVIPLGGSLAATIFLVNIIGDVGTRRFFIHNHRDKGEVGHLFESFSSSYLNQVLVMLLKNLFVWLWSLLLIVPGIIKYYEYLMVPYILTDNPEISWDDAKEQSRAMMEGEKMNAFLLHLSFIGWILLGIITLGILHIVFTGPYMAQAEAELYHVLLEKTGYAAAGSQSGPFDHYGQTYAGGYQAVNTNAPYAGGFSTQDVGYVPQAMQPAAPAPASSSFQDSHTPNPWSVAPAAADPFASASGQTTQDPFASGSGQTIQDSFASNSGQTTQDPFASVPELQTPDPFASGQASGSDSRTEDPFTPHKPASFGDLTADDSDPLSVSGSSSAGGADSPLDSGSQPNAPDFNFSNFDDTDYSFFDD